MTWCLLGKQSLLDERPILSGAHAQHLYLAAVGAEALHCRGSGCCYDPAFYGGYPKTPIFNGSRLAELFLFLAGGHYHPAAYKIGVAVLCMLVPWLLVLAGRGMGLSWPTVVLGTAAGLAVWWSPLSTGALEAGTSELLLGSLAILAHMGLLARFHRHPGILSWLGLIFTGWLGWFAQPMLFPIFLVLFLVYYVNVGHSHELLFWHMSLLLAEVLSLALTATWMVDWATFWWLRAPLPPRSDILRHRTPQTIWDAPLWGGPGERVLVLALLCSAMVGLCVLPRGKRTVARLLAVGTVGLFALALLGISWEPLGALGTAGLLAPALWFACMPAAHLWSEAFRLLGRWLGGTWRAAAFVIVLAGASLEFAWPVLGELTQRLRCAQPLQFTLGPERESLILDIKKYTGSDGRILWEDMPRPAQAPRWTPLLPILTGRSFIGGLDTDATIEHATIGLSNGVLQGEVIEGENWKDAKLEEYCRRYNIGWAICFSPAAIRRFQAWPMAEACVSVADGDQAGVLFTIKRPLSFALKGKAELVEANCRHITLANVVPENGVVVLSLHYQGGMRASPSRVHVEVEPSDADPIGFLRLRMVGPADRVTLTWSDR